MNLNALAKALLPMSNDATAGAGRGFIIKPAMLGPDFLCIGMGKAGTGWLYDQTQYHPDFWMPWLKEVAYLTRPANLAERARAVLARVERKTRNNKPTSARGRPMDEPQLQFLREAVECAEGRMDLARYAALFRHKAGLLSGDITPAYSDLPESTIADLASHFPDLRVLFLVREPVERLWSLISMFARKEKLESRVLDNPRGFQRLLRSKGMAGFASCPTQVVRRWRDAAPQLAFKSVLFDDIVSRPAEIRREIFKYLGADASRASGELSAGHNRKSGTTKLDMTDNVRAVLVERYAEEIRACAKMFGGAAREWPKRYGL